MLDQIKAAEEVAKGPENDTSSRRHLNTDDETSVNLQEAAHVIWDGRRKVGRVAFAGFAVALIYGFISHPYYTATASFLPPSSSSSTSSLLASQLGSLGASSLLGGAVKNTGDLYVGILKSRSIEDDMISRFSLMADYKAKKLSVAEKALAGYSKFDADPKTSIVTVKVTDKSPERARDMANGYLDELRSANQRLALTDSSQRRMFYERQLASEKDALEEAEVELKKTEESTGLIAPVGQAEMQIQSIGQVREQIVTEEAQLAALQQSATSENPEMVRLVSEIGGLRNQLTRMQSGKSEAKVGDIAASKVPEVGLEYIRKEREVKYHETLFQIIARQYESARMDEAHEAPLLQVLDRAVTPDTKAGPLRALLALGGLALGFLGGALWVLVEAAKQRVP